MKWKFWEKPKSSATETTIQVQAHEGGITEILVKAQTPNEALNLFREHEKECKRMGLLCFRLII
jgi:hypothetical protein